MVNNIFVQQYVFFMKLHMASVPQWGYQRHIVFKTINKNVAKCHLFHDPRPEQGFSVDFVPFRRMAWTAANRLINYHRNKKRSTAGIELVTLSIEAGHTSRYTKMLCSQTPAVINYMYQHFFCAIWRQTSWLPVKLTSN